MDKHKKIQWHLEQTIAMEIETEDIELTKQVTVGDKIGIEVIFIIEKVSEPILYRVETLKTIGQQLIITLIKLSVFKQCNKQNWFTVYGPYDKYQHNSQSNVRL